MFVFTDKIFKSLVGNKKIPIMMGVSIVTLVILDMLMTRSVIPFDKQTGNIMFLSTIIIGYGISSFVLLGFAYHIGKELRKKSQVTKIMSWVVITVQSILLLILSLMVLFGNYDHIFSRTIFAISSILASAIMAIMSVKFLLWYKASGYKNLIVFFYGVAALTLSLSIAEDVGTKLLLVDRIEVKTIETNVAEESTFVYEMSEEYDGKIIFREVTPSTTILFVLPTSNIYWYNTLNSIILPIAFVFRWIASAMLLKNVYNKIGKLPISLWIIISLPVLLYLTGKVGFSYGDFLLEMNETFEHYFRILFRLGTIGGNVFFGLAFFLVAKKIKNSKIKDYLIIAGIGDTTVGIALSTSAFEPTFGAAASSLVLFSTYLFSLGLYSSAVSISQDIKLRQTIKNSVIEQSKLLYGIGSAEFVKEIEKKVIDSVKNERKRLAEKTGLQPSFSYMDTKQYLDRVLKETKVIKNREEITNTTRNILLESGEFIFCTNISNLKLAYNDYFETFKRITKDYDKRNHLGIRIITSLMEIDDIEIVKKFLNEGIKVKHVNHLPPINFASSKRQLIAGLQNIDFEKDMNNIITTNEQVYIKHFFSMFEELWQNGVEAKYRIKDINQGTIEQRIEVIYNPELSTRLLFSLLDSSKDEIVAIFANSMVLSDQYNARIIDIFEKILNDSPTKSIKVLIPKNPDAKYIIDKLNTRNLQKIRLRFIESTTDTMISIIVVDKSHSLTFETSTHYDQKMGINKYGTSKLGSIEDIIGVTTYSNSKPTVLANYAIFNSFWEHAELYQELEIHDKMQSEFINVAAHELRTPIQPILGSVYLLKNKVNDDLQLQLVETINRNAKRLKSLTDEILDVTKIQGYSPKINSESFNVLEMILDIVNTYKNSNNKKIKFVYDVESDIFMYADKNGISRVISNLISNALKFIPNEGGFIFIKSYKKSIYNSNNNQSNFQSHPNYKNEKNYKNKRELYGTKIRDTIIVEIKDTGRGIDKEIHPKLFSKFVTKSFQGIGLGLYISKVIIEAHNGKIWAKNNDDGKGATFSFSIPD